MMKIFKRSISAVLAFLMTVALGCFSVSAATITVEDTDNGHMYKAYQIFSGKHSEGILSDINWGTGVDAANATVKAREAAAYIAENIESGDYNGEEIEAYLTSINVTLKSDSGIALTKGDNGYISSDLGIGYYLIRDEANLTDSNDAVSSYMVKVLGNDIEITPKKDVPTIEKKVKDVNDTTGDESNWQDSADYDIGDNVPFQVTVTLPDNFADYENYKVVINDEFSNGLTYNNDFNVMMGEDDVTSHFTPSAAGNIVSWTCNNIKLIDGITKESTLVVTYTAVLNDNAVIGSTGNPNKVNLQFSNNPTQTGVGEPELGKTPDDMVTVFTFALKIDKVNEEDAPLAGAGFTLYKKNADGEYEVIEVKNSGEDITAFTFKGLDDGQYKIEETETPAGYNTIDDIYFTVAAIHDTESANPALTELTVTKTDEAGNTITDDNSFTVESESTESNINTTIQNLKGSTLPETGGMGTKLFYVLGSVLFVGAGILLITKRRMNNI